MSRTKDRMRNTKTSHAIKINGEWINVAFAVITYRCAVCGGRLKRHNAGIICASNPRHRRFVKQAEAEQTETEQQKQLKQIEARYKIVDGQIVPKEN